jgi:hypothetical protein
MAAVRPRPLFQVMMILENAVTRKAEKSPAPQLPQVPHLM